MALADLTRTFLKNLRPLAPGQKKSRHFDTRLRCFFAEVSASGRIVFWLRHTDSYGRRRDFRIGEHGVITVDQARARALELKGDVSRGGDPAGDRDRLRSTLTFGALVADRIFPFWEETIRSHEEYKSITNFRLVPTFGRMRLSEITPGNVAAFRRALVAEGLSNSRVNRNLAVLRRVMNLALGWGLCSGPNPAQSPGMLREEPRELHLTEAEVRALMLALSADPDQLAACVIALLLLTGARRAEIISARWEHVDFERGILTVLLSKSGRRRHVVLSGAAIDVLRLQPRAPGQMFVFPSRRRPGRPIEGVRAAWARAKTAASLPAAIRLHDLRHTFASLCVNDGVPLYDLSKLLGHSNQSVTARYAHLRDDRLLAAANGVGLIAMAGVDRGCATHPVSPPTQKETPCSVIASFYAVP